MKKRWFLMNVVMIAGIAVIMALFLKLGDASRLPLAEALPGLSEAEGFEGQLLQNGEKFPLLLTEDQYRAGLLATEVKKAEAFADPMDPVLALEFHAGSRGFSIWAGMDGRIRIQDSEGAQFFFQDPARSLFLGLYEEHLLSGGQALSE